MGSERRREIATHRRIGERSSHTWFVLKYLLGYPGMQSDDGSWTERGDLADPIEGHELAAWMEEWQGDCG